MAGKRFDVAPLRVSAGWKDLKATKAIEENSDAAEVGVLTECDAPVVDGLWWCLDESDLVSTCAVQSVQTWQRLRRQTKMFIQEIQHKRYDGMGRSYEGLQQWAVLGNDIGCWQWVGNAEYIVFRDLVGSVTGTEVISQAITL